MLKTLKGRGLDELRVRSAQALAALGEQYAGTEQARLPRDAELLRSLNGMCEQHHITSTASLFDYFRLRISPAFFAAFDDRAATLAELRRRWPGREESVISEAEQIAQGRFRLLGFETLDFGCPVDWHLEPVSGKRAPLKHWSRINYLNAEEVGDKKIIWELNRCQHFTTLGQAYWYTRDERHAETFIAHLTGWMDANPPKRGINWASSLEVSFRAISWLWALHFFRESPHLTAAVFARVLKFLYLHARHLETYLSTYFSPNTHLTGEALGLFYLGLMLPEFRRAGQWRALGWKILIDQLDRHVRPDGGYFEQTSYYHRYTADFYTHLFLLAGRHGMPHDAKLERKLTALLDHLMHLTKPDGTTPLFGDDDGGGLVKLDHSEANDFRAALSTGAAIFRRGDYKLVAGGAAEETLWLLGTEGLRGFDHIAPFAPPQSSRAFEDSGHYLLRDGWEQQNSYLLIDCGPHGALSCGHAHADALSFEFAANGANWLVDPGTFTYTGDKGLRDEFRSTAAHNTATVDGQSQSIPAGPFSWSHVTNSSARAFITEKRFDYFAGEHDGYQRFTDPVTHARSVLFVKADEGAALPGYVVVRDSFAATARHRYALHYHFDPACRVPAHSGDGLRAARSDGNALLMRWRGSSKLQASVVEGCVSSCYGQQQAAPVVVCEADGVGTQTFITCLVPVSVEDAATSVKFEPCDASAAESFCLSVRSGEVHDVVLLGDGEARLESGLLAARGRMVWARAVRDRILSVGLVQGNSFECSDGFAFFAPTAAHHCAIERRPDEIEISITGARCFRLTLPEPTAAVILNGRRYVLDPRWCRVAFVEGPMGWRLSEMDC